MPIDPVFVREIVSEVEMLRARRRALDLDIAAVLKRGRAGGVDGRALRAVLTRRPLSAQARRHIDGQVSIIENALAESGSAFASPVSTSAKVETLLYGTTRAPCEFRRPRGRPTKAPEIAAALEHHKDELAPLPLLAQARFLAAHGVASAETCRMFLQRLAAPAAAQGGIDASAAA